MFFFFLTECVLILLCCSVYWALWAGPIHGLPVLSAYSDYELSNMRGIDEVAMDVTAAVQAFVNRPTWNPSGKALFRFTRANWTDPDTFVVARGMCYNFWQCAPQLRFSYRPPGQKKRQLTTRTEQVVRFAQFLFFSFGLNPITEAASASDSVSGASDGAGAGHAVFHFLFRVL